MRTLFSPLEGRPSLETKRLMEELFQSSVPAKGRALAQATPLSRSLQDLVGKTELFDARPWKAGRGPARFERGGDGETTEEEARHGLPSSFGVRLRRSYPWAEGVLSGTSPSKPSDLSGAVETDSGLYVQLGGRLFLISGEGLRSRVLPSERFSVPGTPGFHLVSSGEGPVLRPALPAREENIEATVDRLRVRFYEEAGAVSAAIRGTVSRKVGEGPIDLPYWSGDKGDLGHLYDDEGKRRQYSFSGGELVVGQVITERESGPAPKSGYLLHYQARQEIGAESSPASSSQPEIDLIDTVFGTSSADDPEVEFARRSWGSSFALLTQEQSWRVDGQGHVSAVSTGHDVTSGMDGRYQMILSGDRHLSVVDPVANALRRSQDILAETGGDRVVAPTWTREGGVGVAVAFPDELRVFQLVPSSPVQSSAFTFFEE